MLDDADLELAEACLIQTADGELYEDWEFQTLMGVGRDEMRSIAKRPSDRAGSEFACVAASVVNHLFGYPHSIPGREAFYLSVRSDERSLRELLGKLVRTSPQMGSH